MHDFFSMGGHGVFVWSTVGLTIVILSFNVISARRHVQRAMKHLRPREPRDTNRSTNT